MKSHRKKRSKKSGLPPGTPIHIGEHRTTPVTIHSTTYSEAAIEENEFTQNDDFSRPLSDTALTWVSVQGVHDIAPLKQIATCFQLHPLVLEDLVNTEQRPKVEDYEQYLFLVLKNISWHENTRIIHTEQISIILGRNFVLSFQEGNHDIFHTIQTRLQNGKGPLRTQGGDYLFYALLDAVVDNYFFVLEALGEEIESLEERVMKQTGQESLQSLHELKREMILLRKSVWPLREVVGRLSRGESSLVRQNTQVYLRDVYDHTVQVIETIETYREMLTGILEIYLTSLSNKLNEIMKVMAMIATLFIPLTLIAGIYGMNFKNMPELEWTWGYPLVLAIMGICAAGMVLFFRKRKWL
ncbi:MAG: magnesium/cobalt transporter CorA [Nitrospirales bacterium]